MGLACEHLEFFPGHRPEDFSGQIRPPDNPALRVVIEPVALPGLPVTLGLNRFPAQGGDLDEFFGIWMRTRHGSGVAQGGARGATIHFHSISVAPREECSGWPNVRRTTPRMLWGDFSGPTHPRKGFSGLLVFAFDMGFTVWIDGYMERHRVAAHGTVFHVVLPRAG